MALSIISTVTVSATSYDLTTLANVKDELSIATGDTSNDSVLTRYIGSASKAISNFCNRSFAVETIKDEVWPDREDYGFQLPGLLKTVQLSRYPVTSVVSVTENGDTMVNGTDYRVDPVSGSLIRLNQLPYPTYWKAWPIVAIYQAGFDQTPADVEDAAIRLVKARFLAKGRDPFLKQENIPGVREVAYWVATGDDAGNMPPDVADILDNYRVPVLA